MTTFTPTAPDAATAEAARRPRSGRRLARYFVHSLTQTLRNWAFLTFVIALPTTLYLFFSTLYGAEAVGPTTVSALMMVTMAAYGGLGAAMNAGNSLQTERSTGWFRQLMVTPLTATEFLIAKAAVAVVVIVPALVAVFVAGVAQGVRLPPPTWLAVLGMLLVTLTPMILLGLALGMFFNAQTSQAATTIVLILMSMLGGLMVPLQFMPDSLQAVGRTLPAYWIGELGQWPIRGGEFPIDGVWVLLAWTVGLSVLCVIGYRRAVRTAPR